MRRRRFARIVEMAIGVCAAAAFLAVASAVPVRADGADNFAGVWDTYTSVQPFPHFDLTLNKVSPTHLSGSYRPRPVDPLGHIEGDVDASGTRLNYQWSVGALVGVGSFDLVGNQISGQWTTAGANPFVGTWAGTRKGALPGISISSGGVTVTGPGGIGITIPLAQPGPPGGIPPPGGSGGGGGAIPPGLPTATVSTDTNVRASPGKNMPVVGKLPHDTVVYYEPACPGGYCRVYGNGVQGFVWNQLLDFSGGSAGVPPAGSGGSGGTPPPVNTADFSGLWNLQLVPTGGTAFQYQIQITQAGNNATAKVNSTPPVNMQCALGGAVLTCTWSDGGVDYGGNFARAGNQISGNWTSNESAPLTGTWNGTKM